MAPRKNPPKTRTGIRDATAKNTTAKESMKKATNAAKPKGGGSIPPRGGK